VPDEGTHARTPRRIGWRLASAMSDTASADTPLAVDRMDRARTQDGGVALRLSGRWLRQPATDQTEPLLVVQVQGRRHRFTSSPEGDGQAENGTWRATFHLPSWAEPEREGQAALWVGTAVVPVPVPLRAGAPAPATTQPSPVAPSVPAAPLEGHPRLPPPPALGEARPWPPPPVPPAPPTAPVTPAPGVGEMLRPGESSEPAVDTGRTGPLAELLFKESVSALHAELEQRATDVARLQGSLAEAQSELEARLAIQSALEAAHSDLRGELQELMSAVTVQREDFEKRLATAEERRATAETERDRMGEKLASLAAARDALGAEVADLRGRLAASEAAQQHYAVELSSLRDQLATAHVSRDAALGEVAGLRAELERLGSELAVTREHHAAQGGDLGEAQRLLAEARSLSEQLRSQSSH
jgi:predicted  nucleic acid-binding Zn-ribbon protein